jgi:hypothetical protein
VRYRFRLETRSDATPIAELLLGRGEVRVLRTLRDDPVLAELTGFRTPEREAALREAAGTGQYAFIRMTRLLKGEAVGECVGPEDLVRAIGWPWGGAPVRDPTEPSHQAFLDVLFGFHLPTGRHVRLRHLSVMLSYENLLEGTPTRTLNADYREQRLRWARHLLGEPLVVLEPPVFKLPSENRDDTERFPRMFCSARLESEPLDPDQTSSELTLCWWEERLDRPIPELLAERAAGIDWEASARDWDFS